MKELLLPGTDGGVLAQVVATTVIAPMVFVAVARRHRDLAWLAGRVIALWIALMEFRSLH